MKNQYQGLLIATAAASWLLMISASTAAIWCYGLAGCLMLLAARSVSRSQPKIKLKIKIKQYITGFNDELWGYVITTNDMVKCGGGKASKECATEAARLDADRFLRENGLNKEEAAAMIAEALEV